jgi:uncharacterized protein YhaN
VANEVLGRLADLFEHLKDARGYAERIEEIGHEAEAFKARVGGLAGRVAPELAPKPVEEAAEELIRRLTEAKSNRQKQVGLEKQRRRREEEREAAQEKAEALNAQLAAMRREAGCESQEHLPEAERASEEAVRLRRMLEDLESQLLDLSAGTSVESLVEEAGSVDADTLPGEIDKLNERIEQLGSQRDALRDTIATEQRELEWFDAGSQAAEAAEEAENLLAQIAADAEQYARVRLVWAVLGEAIKRYQAESEGPVLGRASNLFRRLTLDSFQRLVADFDERGEKVLAGDRGDGNPVELAGMSDGTCDQLYLALRLASLEHYLTGREPVPFVVDDVLIGFDNRRAAAALEALGELSDRTQVILFTHHRHLVRLAQEHLPGETLFVHELTGSMAEVRAE